MLEAKCQEASNHAQQEAPVSDPVPAQTKATQQTWMPAGAVIVRTKRIYFIWYLIFLVLSPTQKYQDSAHFHCSNESLQHY